MRTFFSDLWSSEKLICLPLPFRYIAWIANGQMAWKMLQAGMGEDKAVNISSRPVPQEPMVRLSINLTSIYHPSSLRNSTSSSTWGISDSFVQNIDLDAITYPAVMRVDYIRVYQRSDSKTRDATQRISRRKRISTSAYCAVGRGMGVAYDV